MIDTAAGGGSACTNLHAMTPPAESKAWPGTAWLMDEDDTVVQRKRKQTLWYIAAITFVCVGIFVMLHIVWSSDTPMEDTFFVILFYALGLGTAVMAMTTIAVKRRVPDNTLLCFCAAMALSVFVADFLRLPRRQASTVHTIVVVLDVMLVLRAPPHAAAWLIALTVLYVIVITMESSFRFGLLDIWGLWSQEARRETLCGCETLPCAQAFDSAAADNAFAMFTILLDFSITRSFAKDMTTEKERMNKAIVVAEAVAENLAEFDLGNARRRLKTEDAASLPPAFQEAFEHLIANLEDYRPYLPQSLLGRAVEESASNAAPAPGAGDENPEVAVMFTDVRASTKIWATCPEGMRAALAQHNRLLRACIAYYEGYEVKTIGDSFMVAFPSAEAAVQCGMDIQKTFLESEWPDALLRVPECARDDTGLWGGLCLRIGVDFGDVQVEINEVTRRYDYYGDIVNRAARLEANCPPGAVAGRASVMENVLTRGDFEFGRVKEFSVELKGFDGGAVGLMAVVPEGLEDRWQRPHYEWCREVMQQERRSHTNLRQHAYDSGAGSVPAGGSFSSATGIASTTGSHPLLPALAVLNCGFASETATVGTLAIASAHDSWTNEPSSAAQLGAIYQRALQCLHATSGTVAATVHSTIVMSWSARGGLAHCEAAARFVSMFRFHSSHTGAHEPATFIGMATGAVSTGSVGSAQQRFLATLGACVPLSMQLAQQDARALNIPNLFGTRGNTHQDSRFRSIHAVDLVYHSDTTFCLGGDGGGGGGRGRGRDGSNDTPPPRDEPVRLYEMCVEALVRSASRMDGAGWPQTHTGGTAFGEVATMAGELEADMLEMTSV